MFKTIAAMLLATLVVFGIHGYAKADEPLFNSLRDKASEDGCITVDEAQGLEAALNNQAFRKLTEEEKTYVMGLGAPDDAELYISYDKEFNRIRVIAFEGGCFVGLGTLPANAVPQLKPVGD